MNIKEKSQKGTLYVVATPIGNLSDITQRALIVLKMVDVIAAENTWHTNILLKHFSINTRLLPFFDKNKKNLEVFITQLKEGKNIALVSNAGTPSINDPGRVLVYNCHKSGIRVIPLPGPCAAITALSVSGIISHRFYYGGFLPEQSQKRQIFLKNLENKPYTLVFYESPHRLIESLDDMVVIFGISRYVVLARELTKVWETIYRAPIGELLKWVQEDKNRRKGEIVLIIEGKKVESKLSFKILNTLNLLQNEVSLKKAVHLTANIHNVKKNILYQYALKNRKKT